METGDISNEEAEALLSDEKIVTRKQSKADSVARKSYVNSDENVNESVQRCKNLSLTCKHITNLLRIFNTRIRVGSKHRCGKKIHNTIHQRTAGVA